MKNIYIVYRSWAYMRGIVGVYDTEEKAKKGVLSAKSDDYHYFTIKKLELNKNELFYDY